MTDHAELIARLEAATGPGRELDRDVHEAVTGECVHRETREEYVWDPITICTACGKEHPKPDWPRYTASIDAALALVAKVLPGWGLNLQTVSEQYEIKTGPRVFTPLAELFRRPLHEHPVYSTRAATPALAILVALLRALEKDKPHD